MNRSTLWLLIAAAVLAVVTWLSTRKEEAPPPPRLDIAGYASADQLAAEKGRSFMDEPVRIESPIDGLAIEWPGRPRIELKREGEGKDATWRVTAPREAVAQSWAVEQIVALFKSPTQSREARRYSEADARLYGFEPERKARVTAMVGGAVWNGADLYIGDVRRPSGPDESGGAPDTWVMKADDPTWVFAVHAKDLRSPLDKELDALRDKKVLTVKEAEVSALTVTPPGRTAVTLMATRPEAPADDAGAPSPEATWNITAPAGVEADASANSFVRQVVDLRAQSFKGLDEAGEEAKKALAGEAWRWTLTLTGGGTTSIALGAAADGTLWGQVEGRDEVFTVASWTAKNLQKGLEELKDRRLRLWDAARVVGLDVPITEGRVAVRKGAEGWRFGGNTIIPSADPGAYLKGLTNLSATRWARPDEAAAAAQALATPDIIAHFDDAAAETLSVAFGPAHEVDGQQVRWGRIGEGEPFLVSDFTAKKFVTTVDALRPKRLFGLTADAVANVTLTSASGGSVTLEKESGTGPLVVVGTSDGETSNRAAIDALVQAVVGLEARGYADDVDLAKAPGGRHTVVITAVDGPVFKLEIVKPEGDGEPVARVDAGLLAGVVVKLSAFDVGRVLKGRPELVSGGTPTP